VIPLFLFIFGNMEVKFEFEEGDFSSMHDILFDLSGHSYTDKELEKMFNKLPSHIQGTAVSWGMDDTVFGDQVCEYFDNIMKKKGLTKWED
jgi:hypothetical protein